MVYGTSLNRVAPYPAKKPKIPSCFKMLAITPGNVPDPACSLVFSTSPGTRTKEHANMAPAAQTKWVQRCQCEGVRSSMYAFDSSKVANLMAPELPSANKYGRTPLYRAPTPPELQIAFAACRIPILLDEACWKTLIVSLDER